MKYKILVTGGCGFIASHLVDELVKQNHEVVVLDSLEPQVHQDKKPDYLNPKVKYIYGDIRNKELLRHILEDIDVVFHEAAAVGVGQSMYQIEKYVSINTLGTAVLLDAVVNSNLNIKKMIVAASMSSYGEGAYECEDCGKVYPSLRTEEQLKKNDWEQKCPKCKKTVKPIPTDEQKPLDSNSIYAQTKKHQEEMFILAGKTYGIPAVALRYFNVYGPRQSLSNPYTGVCAIFSSRIKNNNSPVIYEDGLQTRDFVNIKDIVQANILAMNSNSANYEIFNVGTGTPISILEIANLLIKGYGKNLKPEITKNYRKGDIRHCYADITKIKTKLGFKPSVSLEQGMKELIEWGRKAESVDMFEKASEELKAKKLI